MNFPTLNELVPLIIGGGVHVVTAGAVLGVWRVWYRRQNRAGADKSS